MRDIAFSSSDKESTILILTIKKGKQINKSNQSIFVLLNNFIFKPSLMIINIKNISSTSRKHQVFGNVPSTMYLNVQRGKRPHADICFEAGNTMQAVHTFTMQLMLKETFRLSGFTILVSDQKMLQVEKYLLWAAEQEDSLML